jgi:hypothetical protein
MLFLIGIGILMFNTTNVYGQTEITFQVDITHLLDENEFDPEQDRVELIGNMHPLSATRPLKMKRDEDEPSLFKATVSFPISMENSQLEYQFRALIDNRYRNEDIPRAVRVTSDDKTIDSLYFNSYAW